MILSGVLGALVGSYLSLQIDEEILRKIFGALLCASGMISLIKLIKARKHSTKALK